MADESDSLTGHLNQVGGAATPSPDSTRPGYGGVLDNLITGKNSLTDPDAVQQLLSAAPNPPAPNGPQSPPLEVDPDVLRDTIHAYQDEIETLTEQLTQCQVVEAVQPPGEEFASRGYVAEHQPVAGSLDQSIHSVINQLRDRKNKLQASLDSYLHTESTNAHNLRPEGR